MKNTTEINNQPYKADVDIAFVIVMIGIILTPLIPKAWIVSLIACPFIKDEDDKHLFI